MPIDYTIAAIPTKYRGRQMRSRLEARWAAFFDHLGWAAEYEPFDLGAWSPDFRLPALAEWGCGLLVEVKPIDEFDAETGLRMVAALEKSGRYQEERHLLLTRVAPRPVYLGVFGKQADSEFHQNVAISIGWLGEVCIDSAPMTAFWSEAFIVWMNDDDQPKLIADVGCIDPAPDQDRPSWSGVLTQRGGYSNHLGFLSHPALYPGHTFGLWARATNAVQWKGPGK